MPLYEYQCKSCGHRFEKIQRFSDEPIRECPKCHKPEAERLLSAPAVQFKGEGWYVTDYARKKTSSSQSNTENSAAPASDSKSDAKPETRSEPKPKKDSKKH